MIDFTTTTATANSHYASRAQLESMKGVKNVAINSNTGGESLTADSDRIDAALAYADRYIDEFLGGVGIVTPVTNPPDALSDIAVQFAYVYLMDPQVYRVTESPDGGPGKELFFAMREAKRRLSMLALRMSPGLAAASEGAPSWESR